MVTIKADLSALSKDQREALCGFILNFPPAQLVDEDPEAISTAPTPSEAFGNASNVTNVPAPSIPTPPAIDKAGPVLVVPPPAEDPTQISVITDKAGLPWDDRIHSSSKGLTADGLWRKKRGASEQEVATVEAELRKLMNLPTPAPAAAPPVPEPPKSPEPVTAIPLPSNVQIVPPPPPPAAAPPAAPANDRQAFVALVAKASGAISNGKMTSEELNSIVKSLGIESLQLLVNRLDLVPQVSTMIDLQLQGR